MRIPVRHVIEQALRRTGNFSTADEGADPAQMAVAQLFLADTLDHMAATGRRLWLVPDEITVPLIANRTTYSLTSTNLSSETNEAVVTEQGQPVRVDEVPDNGIMFIQSVRVREVASGVDRSDVDLIDRYAYDMISDKSSTGVPSKAYVNQIDDQTIKVWRAPAESGLYELKITFQRFADNIMTAGVKGRAEIRADIRRGMQRWLSMALAYEIGGGPVTRLPEADMVRLRADMKEAWADLDSYSNREENRFSRTVYNDLG